MRIRFWGLVRHKPVMSGMWSRGIFSLSSIMEDLSMPKKRGSSVVPVKGSVGVEICPFDSLPCSHVESCDDIVGILFGEVPSFGCSRARGSFC